MEEVREILVEYEGLKGDPNQESTFFNTLINNQETQKVLLDTFNSGLSQDRSFLLSSEFMELFFNLYRYGTHNTSQESKTLVFSFIPKLIFLYLTSTKSNYNKYNVNNGGGGGSGRSFSYKSYLKNLEMFLLVLYNSEKDRSWESCFRIPSLNGNSIYHDGSRIEVSMNNEERNNHKINLPSVRYLNAQNKQSVLAVLFRIFNSRLGDYPKFVLKHFCETSLSLITRGYPKKVGGSVVVGISRIPLNGNILLELLHGAYFCAYNELQRLGNQVVDSIHNRATSDAIASVLMATGAAKSVLIDQSAPLVSVTTPTFSQIAKNMITNASFKTKKMGDDIPVVEQDKDNNLGIIHEEMNSMSVSVDEDMTTTSNKKDFKEKIIAKIPKKLKKADHHRLSEMDKKDDGGSGINNSINKMELKLKKSTNGEIDSLEQVEELIKMKKLPPDTITIHSPESGTTLF